MSNPISPQETQITNALANGLVAMGQRTDALHTKVTVFLRLRRLHAVTAHVLPGRRGCLQVGVY